jgi:two-component system, chemotaxis family, protein-glutamate methylesterase/glutaminase
MTPGHDRGRRDNHRILRVLAVDDSALMRQALAAVLSRARGFAVTTAADPLIAIDKMKKERPDVILLDLEMPRMHGITFLRKIMSEDPIPVVVCSALTGEGTEAALRAFEEGAVDIVTKPRLGLRDFLQDSAVMLSDAVRAAAGVRARAPTPPRPRREGVAPSGLPRLPLSETTDTVVALGASTGGTEALRTILAAMPPDCPGIVVVQHMPEGFTRAFAERLDQVCGIEVKEAADGDRIREGRALVAPGNRHLAVRRSGAQYVARVSDGPLVSRHRPSVDVLFRSVAREAGANAVGVIMTGMGDDGARGLLDMKQAGAPTIAQDEASSVVFGMPREAIALGAVDETVALDRIPSLLLARARGPRRRPLRTRTGSRPGSAGPSGSAPRGRGCP